MHQRKIVLAGRNLVPPSNRRRSFGDYNSDFNTLWEPLRQLESKENLLSNKLFTRSIPSHPNIITEGPIRMLISASPTNESLPAYMDILRRHNVKHVVRLCQPLYDSQIVENQGIKVHDWEFPDGDVPPSLIVSNWLHLLDSEFALHDYSIAQAAAAPESEDDDFISSFDNSSSYDDSEKPLRTVAIHCASGVGRAPLLAALALLECGMDSFEAIALVRGARIGSINLRQMNFLENYIRRPLIPSSKNGKIRARSGSFGSFWSSFKESRPFRNRSPSNIRAMGDPDFSAESYFLPRSIKHRPTRYH